ncbi:hypothetical protein VTI28DRAFT_9670 [Corynascus sepedonium]
MAVTGAPDLVSPITSRRDRGWFRIVACAVNGADIPQGSKEERACISKVNVRLTQSAADTSSSSPEPPEASEASDTRPVISSP